MGMTTEQLQARTRDLIASDNLPTEPPVIQQAGDGFAGFSRTRPACIVCGESDAMVAYFWTGGRLAWLHAAYDAAWKVGREKDFA
jgi:hypothetical protein